MSEDNSDRLIGTVLGGKYKVMALAGEGGMGSLYLAQHTELGRPVAVKVLVEKLSRDEKYLRRFQQEAKLAASLSHPNVAHVYDYGQLESGAPYLVMDFLEGETLGALVRRQGFLSVSEALPVFQQICKGLSHAHGRGMVHRDLKPNNIMLVDSDGERIAKVLDFGIAKEVDSVQGLTQTGELFGSPLYMSPEQCSGQPVDARSDVYSVGCLIYEVLTGQVPLRGDTIVQTIFKHINEMPQPMKQANPQSNVSPAVEAVALRAMSKKPEDRFQTVGQLSEELMRAAATQPAAMDKTAVAIAGTSERDKKLALADTADQTEQSKQAVAQSGPRSAAPGIVVSPMSALAILVAALVLGGAGVLILGNRGAHTETRSRFSTRTEESTDNATTEPAADESSKPIDAFANADTKDGGEGDTASVFIAGKPGGGGRIEIKDAEDGDSDSIIIGSAETGDSPGIVIRGSKERATARGSMSAGAHPRAMNQAPPADSSHWHRDDFSYPLITYTNPAATGQPAVQAIYCHQAWDQGRSQDNDYLHIGHVEVNVTDKQRSPILVLSGYAPIVWNLKVSSGVRIEKVILLGLHQQKVTGVPKGTPVVELSERLPPGPDTPADSYETRETDFDFPPFSLLRGENVAEYSSFKELSAIVKKMTGRDISTFQYCGKEKQFTI